MICRNTGSAEGLDPGAQLVVLDLVGAGGEDVHAANGLVEVAIALHRRVGERADDVVEVKIQAVLFGLAAYGDVLRILHPHVFFGVVHRGDRTGDVAHQATQVHALAALEEVALVHG